MCTISQNNQYFVIWQRNDTFVKVLLLFYEKDWHLEERMAKVTKDWWERKRVLLGHCVRILLKVNELSKSTESTQYFDSKWLHLNTQRENK